MQRNREIELRRSLREIRTAIDKYKDAVDQNLIAESALDGSTDGYPPTLETLVEGVPAANDTTGREAAVSSAHPLRSDDAIDRLGACARRATHPTSKSWGGQNVFDVYTKFEGKALDGTSYRDDW